MFFLLLLIFLFFFPWLLIPLGIFVFINLLLLPFSFTLQSLITLFGAPGQLIKIGTNRRLRINHALEHATINVIEETYGPQSLAGVARENGFFIRGAADPRLIREAAELGLKRLKRGERDLVVHKRCGTSITAANLVSSVIFILLLVQTGNVTLWNMVIALALANLIGPIVGKLMQKYVTTSADVKDVEIAGVEYEDPVRINLFFARHRMPDKFFVRTRQIGRVEVV